jgi:hypothetical protein
MKIREIRDIVSIFDEFTSENLLPLDFQKLKTHKSNLGKFYRIVTETDILTDEEAASEIYGNNHPDNKYKILKSYFTSRLVNTLPFLDFSGTDISEQLKATYKIYKDLFASMTLMRLGRRRAAISLSKKALAAANKYEIHHAATEFIELIRSDSMQKGKIREYKKYSKLLEEKINLHSVETKIKTIVYGIQIYFAATLFTDQKYKDEAVLALKEVEKLLKTGETYTARMAYYRLLYMVRQLEGYPEKSLRACDMALEYMSAMPHLAPKSGFGEFHTYKLENYLIMRDYENGVREAGLCEEYYKAGSNNWFRFKQCHFLLLMQKLKFSEAKNVYVEVTSAPRFEVQQDHFKERWNIFDYYLQYALHEESQKNIKNVFSSAKDKKGLDVAVLILNILHLLEEKNDRQLHLQIEKLSAYRYKYLLGKQSKQSYLLLRLVDVMAECKYDLEKMMHHIGTIERKLEKSKPGNAEILECVQIIPPDWVWAKMKEAMQRRRR